LAKSSAMTISSAFNYERNYFIDRFNR